MTTRLRVAIELAFGSAFALLLLGLLMGCSKPAAQAFAPPPSPVQASAAVGEDVPLYLDEIGRIVAREVVSIQPQVSGRITEIHFADGADVKAGDALFTIDPRPYQARLEAAEAGLAQTKAALDLARIESERVESLADTRAVSKQDIDVRKNAVAVGEARVKESQAAVEMARLNLDYCFIRSPIGGRVGRRLVDLGNIVETNKDSLLVVQRLDPIYADFTITEKNLSAVQRNMARGPLKIEVRLPDEGGEPCAGELTFVDNAVQEATGTVKLRATVPNPDRRLWPGRF
ncbi:MAG TPA: efflux RND transporter periplasmic adaptor subunit, partial [Planctomycetota bacterium]